MGRKGGIDIKSSFPGVDAGVMEALTLAYLSPEYRFLGVAVISAWLVLMCLKTIGHGYFMSVRWHNLKVETHNLRLRHERELRELQGESVLKTVRKQQIQQNPITSSTSEATGDGGAKGLAEHLAAVATVQAA